MALIVPSGFLTKQLGFNDLKIGTSSGISVNKKPNNIVLMALRGIENSRYYEDEFYFDDEEELNVFDYV